MCWGAFNKKTTVKLDFPVGSINSEKYISVISEKLLPFLKLKNYRGMVFQQDNAPPHTSKITKAFFVEKKVEVLPWPPFSPDLNPIENLWSILKLKVAKMCPKNREELESLINREWEKIRVK